MKKLIVAGASLALLFAPVAPASANPTLPAGDVLYEMSCDGDVNGFQLHSLNTSDNTRTAVGTGTAGFKCGRQGAMLQGTNWFYFVESGDGFPYSLVRTDVTSGLTEVIGEFREEGAARWVVSLAIDDNGNAYALNGQTLYSVNLTTGALTSVASASPFEDFRGNPNGFAYDPTTDKFYVGHNGGDGLYSLNMSTGAYTLIATNSDYWVGSMSFDSNGYLWVKGDYNLVSRVAISDFGNSANWIDSALLSPDVYGESLVIARTPSGGGGGGDDEDESLANTGSTDATPYLVGGLLAAGIALAFRRRRV
jgi:LPXTG-motif cell wall-anchored protein